jgi:hypothetical protein
MIAVYASAGGDQLISCASRPGAVPGLPGLFMVVLWGWFRGFAGCITIYSVNWKC